jgi:hypothetical protein
VHAVAGTTGPGRRAVRTRTAGCEAAPGADRAGPRCSSCGSCSPRRRGGAAPLPRGDATVPPLGGQIDDSFRYDHSCDHIRAVPKRVRAFNPPLHRRASSASATSGIHHCASNKSNTTRLIACRPRPACLSPQASASRCGCLQEDVKDAFHPRGGAGAAGGAGRGGRRASAGAGKGGDGRSVPDEQGAAAARWGRRPGAMRSNLRKRLEPTAPPKRHLQTPTVGRAALSAHSPAPPSAGRHPAGPPAPRRALSHPSLPLAPAAPRRPGSRRSGATTTSRPSRPASAG